MRLLTSTLTDYPDEDLEANGYYPLLEDFVVPRIRYMEVTTMADLEREAKARELLERSRHSRDAENSNSDGTGDEDSEGDGFKSDDFGHEVSEGEITDIEVSENEEFEEEGSD